MKTRDLGKLFNLQTNKKRVQNHLKIIVTKPGRVIFLKPVNQPFSGLIKKIKCIRSIFPRLYDLSLNYGRRIACLKSATERVQSKCQKYCNHNQFNTTEITGAWPFEKTTVFAFYHPAQETQVVKRNYIGTLI